MYKHLSLQSLKSLEIIDKHLAVQMTDIFLSEYIEQDKYLQKLIQSKNNFEFVRCIHAMKGSISVFGCASLCKSLKEIEQLAKTEKFDKSLIIYDQTRSNINEFIQELRNFLSAVEDTSAA